MGIFGKILIITTSLFIYGCQPQGSIHLHNGYYLNKENAISRGTGVNRIYIVHPKIENYFIDKDNYLIYGKVVTPDKEYNKARYRNQDGYFFIDTKKNERLIRLEITELKEHLNTRNIEFKLE